jgi:hypothetical protein
MPITIFRCGHGSEELNEKFKELFEECDILVVECGNKEFYNEFKEHLNQLSQIGYSTHNFERRFEEVLQKLEDFIKNSKKQIEVEKSPISLEEYRKVDALFLGSQNVFMSGKLEDACTLFSACCKYMVEIVRKRDAALAEQLIKLQRKNENKKILLEIGAGHFVHYELKKRGIAVKQEFPYLPYTFSLADELRRRIQLRRSYTWN